MYNSIFIVTDKFGINQSQAYARKNDCIEACGFDDKLWFTKLPRKLAMIGPGYTGDAYMDEQTKEVYYIKELTLFGELSDVRKRETIKR